MLDLDEIKAAAQAAVDSGRSRAWAARAEVVLEIIERLERAEADIAFQKQVTDAARQQQTELLARAERADLDAARYRHDQENDYRDYVRRCPKHGLTPISLEVYRQQADKISDRQMAAKHRDAVEAALFPEAGGTKP